MALDFPSSPALNQVFTSGNRSWIWNGTEWIGNTPIINYTANSALLGNGTSLFQEVAPGTAGNILTSNGTTWTSAAAPAGGISNVVTATGNTTLTSTPTLLCITPTGYGTTVKLPNATTMSVGTGKFEIENLSAFHVRITNTSDTLLGFVNAYSTVEIELANNSTAAGVWTLNNALRLGVSAERGNQFTTGFYARINNNNWSPIELDNDRVFFLLRDNADAIFGQVYSQSTNTWGAQTLIRNAAVGQYSGAVKIDANKVIVASAPLSTAFEAVVLSISGTTITVNSATASTLAVANSGAYAFKAVPSGGFVYVYRSAAATAYIVPMSVSGTTVTIGTVASQFAALVSNASSLYVQTALDKIILYCVSDGSGTGGFIAYSLSGSTLTAGSRVSIGKSTGLGSKFVRMTDTTFFFDAYTSTSTYVGVISLSGTTITAYISANINISGSVESPVTVVHCVTPTKVFFVWGTSSVLTSGTNILTYTHGSGVSLGTYLTDTPNNDSTVTRFVGANGNDVSIIASDKLIVFDASGVSPTIKTVVPGQSIRPDSDLSDGTHPGMFSEFRVSGIFAANSPQYAFGLRSYIVLPSTGSSNAVPIVPPENPKLGFIFSGYSASGAVTAAVIRKYELV